MGTLTRVAASQSRLKATAHRRRLRSSTERYSIAPSGPPGKQEGKLYKALNAPFTLWLCSAVFVSLLSWAYNRYDAYNKEAAEIRRKLLRLDNEVLTRLEAAGVLIRLVPQARSTEPAPESKRAAEYLRSILDAPKASDTTYPEFANRGLASLLNEVQQLTPPKSDERRCAGAALNYLRFTRAAFVDAGIDDFSLEEAQLRMRVLSQFRWAPMNGNDVAQAFTWPASGRPTVAHVIPEVIGDALRSCSNDRDLARVRQEVGELVEKKRQAREAATPPPVSSSPGS